MGLVNMIRNGMRSFLRLEKAHPNSIVIQEEMTFADNAAKNRIWYRGKSYELQQLYSQLSSTRFSFWGAQSTQGQEIRKIHTGLPGIIVKKLRDVVLYDLNDLEFKDAKHQDLWESIAEDNNFEKQIKEAVKDALVIGDGAFRISFDSTVSQYPIIEWISGERIEIEYKRGRLYEVVFSTRFEENKRFYTLQERYGFGYVKNALFLDNKKIEVHSTEYTQNINDFEFDKRVILCVPFSIFESDVTKGRGESIFDSKTDTFDSLDETWSQWMDALRTGRTKEYIPESLLPRDPWTGQIMKSNTFDNRFIKIESDSRENGNNEITTTQSMIQHESYLATYVTALDLALQGLISPSTLGIDVKKLDNAEAQREKEKTTLYTRNTIVEALQEFIPRLVSMVLNSYNVLMHKPIEEIELNVPFGEYANPSFESQVETVAKAKTGGIMSLEASVDELYGDSKDEQWKSEEVARLKAEQGISEVEEPYINTELDGFSIERGDELDSTNHESNVQDANGPSKSVAPSK
jgi:hypothetical protein|nr:MAG TPA: portal protein [Caudoviricetes sp.]